MLSLINIYNLYFDNIFRLRVRFCNILTSQRIRIDLRVNSDSTLDQRR